MPRRSLVALQVYRPSVPSSTPPRVLAASIRGNPKWRSHSEPPRGPVNVVRNQASGKHRLPLPRPHQLRKATSCLRIGEPRLHGSSCDTPEQQVGAAPSGRSNCPNLEGHKMRLNEAAIAEAVERYLADAGGEATIPQIRRALPRYLQLTPPDRQKSRTRPREEIWEQQVRNIVCHRDSEGNPVKSGKMLYQPRRLRLAESPQGDLFDQILKKSTEH